MCSKEHGFRRTKTVFETVGLSSPLESVVVPALENLGLPDRSTPKQTYENENENENRFRNRRSVLPLIKITF